MIYAGIGSRETPGAVLLQFEAWGRYLSRYGVMLRSGRAKGADSAFEVGCANGPRELFTARNSEGRQNWHDLAARFHPNWSACSDYAKLLHARNGAILFGADLQVPVDFVICWTKDGKASGGTGQALRMAQFYSIETFNFFFSDSEERLREYLIARGFQ